MKVTLPALALSALLLSFGGASADVIPTAGGDAADAARDTSAAGPMRLGLAGASTKALGLTATADFSQASQGVSQPTALEAATLRAVNQTRRERRLQPVRFAPALRRAAIAHTKAMAQHGYFDHASPGGGLWWRRIRGFYPVGQANRWAVGENLIWSSAVLTPAEIVRLWLDSPKHRAILLDPEWREAGIGARRGRAGGLYKGQTVTIMTADFGIRR